MFGRRFHLFTLMGFRVGLDLSWFLLAILLVWSLAGQYFPSAAPGLDANAYLWMGVAGAIGLFASIVLHELAHAVVARRFDLPISGITLFIFGGVAEMTEEPATPGAEFWMAIAGPIASLAIAAVLYLLAGSLDPMGSLGAVAYYLAFINLVLAVFNMLPAFPLDGGRVLRSAIWWFTSNFRKATRIASMSGFVLGGALMLLGIVNIIGGNVVGGLWQLLIGFFIQSAASLSRSHADLRQGLAGIRVRDVMKPNVVSVPVEITVAELVENYFYLYYHKFFPVIDGQGRALGCVRLSRVRDLPRDRWVTSSAADIMEPVGPNNILNPSETAIDALKRMKEGGASRFMVVQDGILRGVLSMRDILDVMAVRLELEEPSSMFDRPWQAQAGTAAREARFSARKIS